jgi:putative ABC transport system substrate-binding protein
MQRREFVTGLTAAIGTPVAASAQPPAKAARIGILESVALEPSRQRLWDGFRQRLRELGYREGEHVAIEMRSTSGDPEQFPALATQLVRLNVAVIVAVSTPGAIAAKRATATIPIVMTNAGDPVGSGLVASLAHPGGNVTGLTTLTAELTAKRFELLRHIVPTVSRVAVLWEAVNPAFAGAVRDLEATARSFNVQTVTFPARSVDEVDRAFAAIAGQRLDGLIVIPGALFIANRKRVTDLALRHRIPAVYAQREFVESGGLAAYGSSLDDLFARAADFVVKILKGARPADLPVEQPTKFELAVNLKTAKALGLTIPTAVLARADVAIE